MYRKVWVVIAALALLVVGSGATLQSAPLPRAPHASMTHVTLWLDYTPWGAHVPFYTALSLGYFRREGLDVSLKVPPSVTDPLKLVAASHSNTLGIGYMSDIVTAEAKDIPVMSVAALVQHSLNCIMTLKSSGITSPTQLAGKKIGAAETPADNVILTTVFKHAHVLGKVQRVNVNYDYVPALLQHRVDAIEGAYQVWEGIEIEQAGQQFNCIKLSQWGVPDTYELVLIANRSMVQHQPTVIRRFLVALKRGEHFAVTHPDAAVRIFIHDNSGYNNPKGRYLVSHSWHALIRFVQPPGVRFGSQSAARWHHEAVWMYRNHLVSRLISTSQLFTNRFDP
jgi:putative hydroxymethylpyrimidine transport system substrate-binding protein